MIRRIGRPGLLGTMARTAVVAAPSSTLTALTARFSTNVTVPFAVWPLVGASIAVAVGRGAVAHAPRMRSVMENRTSFFMAPPVSK